PCHRPSTSSTAGYHRCSLPSDHLRGSWGRYASRSGGAEERDTLAQPEAYRDLEGITPYRGEPPARRSVSRSHRASLCTYVLEGSLEGLPLTSQCRKPLRACSMYQGGRSFGSFAPSLPPPLVIRGREPGFTDQHTLVCDEDHPSGVIWRPGLTRYQSGC